MTHPMNTVVMSLWTVSLHLRRPRLQWLLTTLPFPSGTLSKRVNLMFQVVEEIEAHLQRLLTSEELDNLLEKTLSFQECDSYLIHQSYRALLASGAQSVSDDQSADLVNGLIITDSESEDPEMWSQAKSLEEEKKKVVEKQRAIMRCKLRRQRAKRIASARFLSRKIKKNAWCCEKIS